MHTPAKRHFIKKLVVCDTVEGFREVESEDTNTGVGREHEADGMLEPKGDEGSSGGKQWI